jgi:hypothetical protein
MDTSEPPMQLPPSQLQQEIIGGGVVGLPQQMQLHHPQMLQNELKVVRRAGRQAVRYFLEAHSCFAVVRTSGKVVVFDTRIPIQLAFYALVEHGTLSCRVLWWWWWLLAVYLYTDIFLPSVAHYTFVRIFC